MDGRAVVTRARACVGARFRLQGRDPATGLDCVGLAAAACGVPTPPARYALRGGQAEVVMAAIDATGLKRVAVGEARAGDVVLAMAGARQFHLLVLTGQGFVHADARLRRVVEVPSRPGWPLLAAWRKE